MRRRADARPAPFRLIAPLVAVLLGVAGCAGEAPDRGAAAAPDEPRPERRFLSIGTAPPGGAFFVVGGALADTLSEAKADAGWQVTAEATKGTQENIRRLARGELDLALANSAITYFAVRGEEGWAEPQPVSAVMTLAPNVALFVAPSGSGVDSIADLKGKRVVLGPAGAGFDYFLRPILAAHGLGWDELDGLNATQAGAVDLLADGAAAAAFLGGAVPTASITQVSASQDVVFLPYEPAAVETLVGDYPFFARATIPAGTYRGQDEDYHGLDVGSMHLIAASAAGEGLVYELTKAIYEGRQGVVDRHPAGRAIRPEVVIRDLGTPFHPGAERYYREIGIWPRE